MLSKPCVVTCRSDCGFQVAYRISISSIQPIHTQCNRTDHILLVGNNKKHSVNFPRAIKRLLFRGSLVTCQVILAIEYSIRIQQLLSQQLKSSFLCRVSQAMGM